MVLEINLLSSWCIIATIYLIILTVQDIKNLQVDDRKNYFMIGYTMAFFVVYRQPILYSFLLLTATIFIIWMMNKYMFAIIGKGDTHALFWIFLGWGISSLYKLLIFMTSMIIVTILFYIIIIIVKKILKTEEDKPLPYFIVILFSFILTCLVTGSY